MTPTPAQIDSACLSFRHDFGLLSKEQQDTLRLEAKYWLEAWDKELHLSSTRKALVELVGESNENSLVEMRNLFIVSKVPEEEKRPIINAINVLLMTM